MQGCVILSRGRCHVAMGVQAAGSFGLLSLLLVWRRFVNCFLADAQHLLTNYLPRLLAQFMFNCVTEP